MFSSSKIEFGLIRICSKRIDEEVGKRIIYDSPVIQKEIAEDYFKKFDEALYKNTSFVMELFNNSWVSIPVSEIDCLFYFPEKDDSANE